MNHCYICERPIIGKGEHDHFPLPRSLGGEMTMPICKDCHHAKDRVGLGNWDASLAFSALSGLWEKANATERLMLGKMFHVCSQGAATLLKTERKKNA